MELIFPWNNPLCDGGFCREFQKESIWCNSVPWIYKSWLNSLCIQKKNIPIEVVWQLVLCWLPATFTFGLSLIPGTVQFHSMRYSSNIYRCSIVFGGWELVLGIGDVLVVFYLVSHRDYFVLVYIHLPGDVNLPEKYTQKCLFVSIKKCTTKQ